MLYPIKELTQGIISPCRFMINVFSCFEKSKFNLINNTITNNILKAYFEMLERTTRAYPKLEYAINSCEIEGKTYDIVQQSILSKSFCHLIHFKKLQNIKQPKLLIIAPMSGHHATLLRSCVQDSLVNFDCYLTDWVDAREVDTAHGEFNLDTYIDYCVEFVNLLSPNINILAICQASVPALIATAIAHEDKKNSIPDSLSIMGGPIDTSKNPTEVNKFAHKHSYDWFKANLITQVPEGYTGHGRLVYPGFLQVIGFVMMNPKRHFDSHLKLFNYLVTNADEEKIMQQRNFYDEYFSVMDMSAEFYLQTIKEIFQDNSLARGVFKVKDHVIDLSLITKTALLCIEGERDDITGIGQTKAALTLCRNLDKSKKKYHLQQNTGHYGLFSGRRYRQEVLPLLKEFVKEHSKESSK
jgi:poly(3-hydroxybutyrate) depolymerase